MKRIRLLWGIVKRCHLDKFTIMFFFFFFAAASVIWMVEPEIYDYGEATWYLFVSCTSIGYGDVVAVTTLGRMITAFITIYEIIMVAMVAGVIVSHYIEVINAKEKDTATIFIDKLEHLSELSKEELVEIENRVKKVLKDE